MTLNNTTNKVMAREGISVEFKVKKELVQDNVTQVINITQVIIIDLNPCD